MANTVFQFPVPDPAVAALFDGEVAIGPTSNSVVPAGMRAYYMARSGLLKAGYHTIKIYADNAVSMWIGSALTSRRMVLSTNATNGVQTFDFEVFDGEDRIDLYLQNMDATASPCWTVFSIYRNGTPVYGSKAQYWQWETTPLPDAALLGAQDARLSYPVFTLLPNWENGMLEQLQYLTDIMSSERTIEQRRSLRTLPRRTIEAGFMRTRENRARLDSFFTGVGTKKMLVPIWFEQYRLTVPQTPASDGVTFPKGTLALREFRAGDLVLINNKDPNVYDVAIISTLNYATDTITWERKPTRNWGVGARITPLRLAQMLDPPSLGNRTSNVGVAQVRFSFVDPEPGFSASWGNCSPLFQSTPNWSEDVTAGYNRDSFITDNGINSPWVVDLSDMSTIERRLKVSLRGRLAVNNFRRFIAMARGRAVRFYLPTFAADVWPAEDVNGNSFLARSSNFWETVQTRQNGRYMLGFYFKDGARPIYREVSAVEPVQLEGPPYTMTGERYHVAEPLPPIDLARIQRVSWVEVVRFDQDTFELQHETDESRVVEIGVVTRTVDATDMPPIECWVTSRPYAQEVVDMISTSGMVLAANLYSGKVDFNDSLSTEGALLAADLIQAVRYLSYTMPPDEIGTAGTIIDAEVSTVHYLDVVMAEESVNTVASIESANLYNALVRFSPPEESIKTTATILQGSFS